MSTKAGAIQLHHNRLVHAQIGADSQASEGRFPVESHASMGLLDHLEDRRHDVLALPLDERDNPEIAIDTLLFKDKFANEARLGAEYGVSLTDELQEFAAAGRRHGELVETVDVGLRIG